MSKKIKKQLEKTLEISIGLLATSLIIMLVFAGLYFAFGYIKKNLSGNIIYEDIVNIVGPTDWMIITFLAAIFVGIAFYILLKKKIFVIKF